MKTYIYYETTMLLIDTSVPVDSNIDTANLIYLLYSIVNFCAFYFSFLQTLLVAIVGQIVFLVIRLTIYNEVICI